jgi:mannosyltransferase OCH1-like enzyme
MEESFTVSKFEELMGEDLSKSIEWNIAARLYHNFVRDKNKEQLIPKKIHQIWFGEMPNEHKKLIPGIREKHPGWEYKLWTIEDAEQYPMRNRELFDKTENLGSKSDIFRYEVLYNEGGIYLDSDFDMVKSFDSLLHNELFTGIGHVQEPEVFNGLIGCTKNHELMGKIVEGLEKESVDDIMSCTGPYYFTKHFFNYLIHDQKSDKIVILPTPYFYPFPAVYRHYIRNKVDRMKKYIHSFNTKETICVHLWFNSWQ